MHLIVIIAIFRVLSDSEGALVVASNNSVFDSDFNGEKVVGFGHCVIF